MGAICVSAGCLQSRGGCEWKDPDYRFNLNPHKFFLHHQRRVAVVNLKKENRSATGVRQVLHGWLARLKYCMVCGGISTQLSNSAISRLYRPRIADHGHYLRFPFLITQSMPLSTGQA
jgi:hypothetical protein